MWGYDSQDRKHIFELTIKNIKFIITYKLLLQVKFLTKEYG